MVAYASIWIVLSAYFLPVELRGSYTFFHFVLSMPLPVHTGGIYAATTFSKTLNLFSIPVTTNYHTLSGLKHTNLLLYGYVGLKSETSVTV